MTKELHKGDKVGWDSSGGHSTGKVVKKRRNAYIPIANEDPRAD